MGGHPCPAGPTVGQTQGRQHCAGMLSQWDFTPLWAAPHGFSSQVRSGGFPAGRQAPLPAQPAWSCRKGPPARAVGPPWQGSPMAGGIAVVALHDPLAPGRGSHPVCSPPQFPSPFPPQGGGGQGFPFHKSEELQDGNPGSQLQNRSPPPPKL